jgi:hypothetical protein
MNLIGIKKGGRFKGSMTVRSALIGPTPGVIIGDSKKNRIDSENIAAMV